MSDGAGAGAARAVTTPTDCLQTPFETQLAAAAASCRPAGGATAGALSPLRLRIFSEGLAQPFCLSLGSVLSSPARELFAAKTVG